jgi:YD repeat-containing protein
VIGKQVNGATMALYGYDDAGRLIRRTDALNQTTNYAYTDDDRVAAISYTSSTHATPGVQFEYDLYYPRLVTMTDAFGSTVYTYNPVGTLGAGQIASITAPAPNHTISFQYDVIGRRIGETLDGIVQTRTYDSEDRLATLSSPLGTFAASYAGSSRRMTALSYPNGQGVAYTYLDVLHDLRLSQATWGSTATGFNLSQFNYSYDAAHQQIVGLTWHDLDNPTGRFFNFTYDGAQQLLSRQQTTDPTKSPVTTLHTDAFGYDASGNRTSETLDSALSTATYDGANQLIAIERGLTLQGEDAIRQLRARQAPPPPPRSVTADRGAAAKATEKEVGHEK